MKLETKLYRAFKSIPGVGEKKAGVLSKVAVFIFEEHLKPEIKCGIKKHFLTGKDDVLGVLLEKLKSEFRQRLSTTQSAVFSKEDKIDFAINS